MINETELKKLIYNSDTGKLINQRCRKEYLEKRGFNVQDILNMYDGSESLDEALYRVVYNITKRPTCKVCGKPLSYTKTNKFVTFCSAACSTHDPDVLAKNKAGVSKALKKAYEERGDEIKAKRAATLGNESGSPFENKDVQEKIKQTTLERYGVDNVFRLEQFRGNNQTQMRKRSIKLWKERGYDIEYQDDNVIIKNGCKTHGDIILTVSQFNNRMCLNRMLPDLSNVCLKCKPWGDRHESSIEIIMKQILDELQIKYEQHNRTLISPQELDFYLPDYNIAIECNGIWWHSNNYLNDKKYHFNKYKKAEEAGIKMISFWEHEINFCIHKIKAYLQTIFGKNNKIYARQCIVQEITADDARNFLNDYHLQGAINATYRYGLFYNNELVEVMTLSSLRMNKATDEHYELYRLCTKAGYTVIGGASKLLEYFKKKYPNWKVIESYCHSDISSGDIYKKLGFKYVSNSGPGQFFINHKTYQTYSRYAFVRRKLKDIKPDEKVIDYLYNRGILTCYNSGVTKWRLKNE